MRLSAIRGLLRLNRRMSWVCSGFSLKERFKNDRFKISGSLRVEILCPVSYLHSETMRFSILGS